MKKRRFGTLLGSVFARLVSSWFCGTALTLIVFPGDASYVEYSIENLRFTVIAPIEREMPEQPRRIVTPAGKRAVTHISKICEKNGFTLLRFRLETGRTHQIRVHCAALGLPLCGDLLYGGTEGDIDRPALHMAYLSLINPITGKRISACAKLPEDIKKLLE